MAKLLNLDEVTSSTEMSLKIGGIVYPLKELTVDDFLQNMKDIENLPTTATVEEEYNLTLKLICRVFPTLTRDILGKLTLAQLKSINEFARTANEEDEKPGEGDTEGNLPAQKSNPTT